MCNSCACSTCLDTGQALDEQIEPLAPLCTECLQCRAVAERKRIKLQQSEKDAEAMSLMQKLRVTWTSEEDSLVSTDALLYFQISSLTCICHSIFTISDIDSCVLAVES